MICDGRFCADFLDFFFFLGLACKHGFDFVYFDLLRLDLGVLEGKVIGCRLRGLHSFSSSISIDLLDLLLLRFVDCLQCLLLFALPASSLSTDNKSCSISSSSSSLCSVGGASRRGSLL